MDVVHGKVMGFCREYFMATLKDLGTSFLMTQLLRELARIT